VLGAVSRFVSAVVVLAALPLACAADAPVRLLLRVGFGGAVTSVHVLRAGNAPPACVEPLAVPGPNAPVLPGTPESRLFGTPPDVGRALCVAASTVGLEVYFRTTAARPIAFEYPATLSCVTLEPSDVHDLLVHVDITVDGRARPVECDVDRAFLYALSIERHASAKPYVQPNEGAAEWHATIEIPWAVLELRGREPRLHVAFSAPSFARPLVVPLDVAIEDRSGALGLAYAPLVHFETPAPSPKRPGPRLHQVEADVLFVPDRHTMLDAAFAQNDAAAGVQRAAGQILHGAPLPLPSGALAASGPDTIITRTQPLVGFLRPSNALGDQDLRVFVDALPFALDKVPSLASGYTAGYASPIVGAGAFYGLQRSGLYDQAYALTVNIPTPSPRVAPSPTPVPSPSPTPTPVKLGVAPPPLATPGPVEESKTSHDPLATIALLDSLVGNGTSADRVAGIAFGTNFYRNVCASDASYCAVTFHVFGSEQYDAHPLVSLGPAAPFVPPDAFRTRFGGESVAYTKILSATGSIPNFFQIGETFGAQRADRFYGPASGTVTAFAPLSGSLGHVVFSYGTGFHEHTYSVDLLGVRLTSPYGDVFTNIAEQVVVPFDLASLRGWTFNAGVQSESLSDRVAELQQGLATSYFSAVFPTAASYQAPVASAVIRPQSQQNATVTSPYIGNVLTAQATGGYQNGSVTVCAPTPKSVLCSTAHDHAATWALFLRRAPIGFGLANTASAAIPGDLAAGSTSRYFGSYVNAPGSVTSYLSFAKCVDLSAAYTNAAFPTGVPLPQKGSTISAKAYVPLGPFGVEGGYFRTTDTANTTLNQSGYYALVRFLTVFRKADPAPGCSR
jgi:hypothetical protein